MINKSDVYNNRNQSDYARVYIDVENKLFMKDAKLKYLTDDQWKSYYDYMASHTTKSYIEFSKVNAVQMSIFDLIKDWNKKRNAFALQ